jgi:radical SAM protein with 4Fe4S-binding SPASM domain
MNNYNFNGHKLAYHPERVAQYVRTGDCFPLYVEISPVGNCNHRCLFCAYDYIGHPNRHLDTGRVLTTIEEMAACGVKSIVLAGEGEPLLHPDIGTIIGHIRTSGIDVGLFTNGQALNDELARRILPDLSFVRFSFNGGSAQSYAKVHQVKPGIFNRVLGNMRDAARIKNQLKLCVDIGAQYVLIPENKNDLYRGAAAIKEAGLDYLAVKPFILQRPEQLYQMAGQYDAHELEALFDQILSLSGEHFAVVVRKNGFAQPDRNGDAHCRGCSFITVINSAGDVATCLPYWDKPEFVYGNIYQNRFEEIWRGEKRKALQKHLESDMDTQRCPPNCRPNAINAYLSDITNPSVRHVNFI